VWSRFRASPDVVASFGVLRTFQNIRLFRRMSVLENVLLGMESTLRSRFWGAVFRTKRYRHEEEVAREKARELLAFVGLNAEEGLQAESLSYGAQRRLEIARALASDPKLLLLDEPAAGMNPAETAALGELIHRIRARGVSLLLIEHHMNVVMKLSDRIVVLEYGNKIAEGTPEEIQRSERVIEAYLGKSS
jgi:branched-chain amino acid transport system ATP-binding protein